MKIANGVRLFPLLLIAVACLTGTAAANSTGEPASAGTLESDPLTCWWKADRNAVFVGEQFGVTLTCRVVQAGKVSVIPNWTAIEPGSIQLAPFEVVSGVRHAAIESGIWQYFQYEYRVRLIADSFFGQDIDIPPLRVIYNVRMMQGEVAQQGRDRTYLLPALPMRMLSVVTGNAKDIRDASHESFAEIEQHAFRATAALVAALVFGAFAVILIALLAVRSAKRAWVRTPVAQRQLSVAAITRGCEKELASLHPQLGGAAPPAERLSRALAALRVAAAITIGHSVTQTRISGGQEARVGQFLVRPHWFSRQSVAVSASVTPETLSRWLAANVNPPSKAWRNEIVAELREALVAISSARYGREEARTPVSPQGMVDSAIQSLRRLQIDALWHWRRPATSAENKAGTSETAWAR